MVILIFKLNPFEEFLVGIFFALSTIVYLAGITILLKPMLQTKNQLDEICDEINSNSDFTKISRIINNYPQLQDLFTDFKKTLRCIFKLNEATGVTELDSCYATVSSENYFNEGSIIYNNIYYKTLNFLPQVLTGLGIFGTFLGVVQGLPNLSTGFSSQELQSTIPDLLSGVKVSFRTSLYGIAYSMALTLLMKIVFDIVASKIHELNKIIDGSLTRNTEFEGLKELEKQLEKQTSSIERLATDISESLGQKIDTSLEENMKRVSEGVEQIATRIQESFEGSIIKNLSPALERLSVVSEELSRKQEEASNQFLTDVIKNMRDAVSIGTQNEMEKLKGSLEIMTEKNNDFISRFMEGMSNIEELFTNQKDLIRQTNMSTENLNLTGDNIRELVQGLEHLVVDVKSLNNNNNQSVEELTSVFEKLRSFSFEQNIITERLSDMVDKTYEYTRAQENYMDVLQNSTTAINDSVNNSKNYIENITQNLKLYLDNFKEIKDISLEITDRISYNFTDIVDKLETSSDKLNESIERVNQDIISNVSDVSKEIVFVSRELNNFYENIKDLSIKIEDFARVELSTQQLWENYHESFDNLNKNINEGINDYTEAIKRGTYDVFEVYDSKIAEAVKELRNLVESIHSEVEEIQDALEEMPVGSTASN